ncbi:O-antigen ligase family protein [uncultured Paraglaciecola sp.]|uniref:O-antigen ligase family protein n=1 Tax=uncultured Paraglaciecola sp. TaxID=1765024 RepID=UPI0030DD24D3|tara:strand:+ start:28489 stop:29820 length:1332 start_codon:yes stop_codon:yes gene_type:complete
MLSVLLFLGSFISSFALSFRHAPIFAFVLYQMIYFFNPQNRWWGSLVPDLGYSFFSVAFMAVILLINWPEAQKNKLAQLPSFRWLYVFVAIYSAVYIWSSFPSYHIDALIPLVKSAIIMSIAFKLCNSPKALDYMLYGYASGAAYLGYYIFQVGRNSGDRVEGIGMVDSPDANGVAAALAPAAVACLFYFWRNNLIKHKIPFIIAGAFIVNALALINSRGAMLGLAAGGAYFMWRLFFAPVQRKNQKLTVVLITLAGLASLIYVADKSTIERIYSISEESEVDETRETGATRMVFWVAAMDLAKDHPLGLGRGGFEMNAPLYIPRYVNTGRSRNRAVHSSWFEALSEAGYLGLFALIMIVISSFLMTKKCKKLLTAPELLDDYFKVICIESMLITFVVTMSFLNRMRAEIFVWCILFVACAYNVYYLRKLHLNSEHTEKHVEG